MTTNLNKCWFSEYMQAFKAADPGVSFCERKAYLHVHGPSQPRLAKGCRTHSIVIERNGTVAFDRTLGLAMNAFQRPNLAIRHHPLGHSSGPGYGRFMFAMSIEDVRAKFESLSAFASAVVAASKSAELW